MEIANAQPKKNYSVNILHNQSDKELNLKSRNFVEEFLKEGIFLVNTNFKDKDLKTNLVIYEGNTYYRYMDYLYSPKPIQNLSENEIIELCDLRLKYFSDLVDKKYNFRVLNCIINEINKNISGNLSILDFGCGDGYYTKELEKLIPNSTTSGVDLSHKAVNLANTRGVNANTISISNGKINYFSGTVNQLDESFDVIVSMFVLHFKIDFVFIEEISRLLKKNGFLIFNFYNTFYTLEILMNDLINTDFDITELNNCGLPSTHKMFLCKKRF